MKKLSVIFAIVTALLIIGCASSGGSAPAGEPLIVDLSKLKQVTLEDPDGEANYTPTGGTVTNVKPFVRNYQPFLILFDEPINVSGYTRATINCKYFSAEGEEIKQGDGNAMVSLIIDPAGEKFSDGSPNLALKELNVGGFSGIVSSPRGVRIRKTDTIGAVLLQNSNVGVKFIELTEIVFHNGDFER